MGDWTLGCLPVDFSQLTPQEQLTSNRLSRWYRQSVARDFVPGERVAKCYRVRVSDLVSVLHSKKFERAHYGGLMTCGSVWHCPVCAAKISERRRVEIQSLIDKASAGGYSFFLATFTLQHSLSDSLTYVRKCLTDALEKTKSGRWWGQFTDQYGIVGNVAKTEVTYGAEFGWHFHKHLLFITSQPMDNFKAQQIRDSLSARYERIIADLGGYAHPVYGVDVRVGDTYIADYVSKHGGESPSASWSLAAEVGKSFSKIAKGVGHFTPFQLLDYKDTASIFQEYALSMKGYNQLRWSNGLRKKFDLGEAMSDEELASLQDDDASLFAHLTVDQWSKILRADLRGQLLEVASIADPNLFQNFLKVALA